MLGAVSTLMIALYFPPARRVFHFSVLHFDDLLIAVAAGFLGVVWFEALKLLARQFGGRKAQAEAGG